MLPVCQRHHGPATRRPASGRASAAVPIRSRRSRDDNRKTQTKGGKGITSRASAAAPRAHRASRHAAPRHVAAQRAARERPAVALAPVDRRSQSDALNRARRADDAVDAVERHGDRRPVEGPDGGVPARASARASAIVSAAGRAARPCAARRRAGGAPRGGAPPARRRRRARGERLHYFRRGLLGARDRPLARSPPLARGADALRGHHGRLAGGTRTPGTPLAASGPCCRTRATIRRSRASRRRRLLSPSARRRRRAPSAPRRRPPGRRGPAAAVLLSPLVSDFRALGVPRVLFFP